MKKMILPLLFALLGTLTAFSQTDCIKGNVHYEIVSQNNGTLVFDLFIGLDAQNNCGPIKLGTADFVLNYNEAAFTNPTLKKTTNQDSGLGLDIGYCDFIPTYSINTTASKLVKSSYQAGLSGVVKNGQMLINLNAISPSNQNELDTRIANIEESTRLGRFSMTGYAGNGHGLDLALEGTGFTSKIYSYEQEAPFTLYAVEIRRGFGTSPGEIEFEEGYEGALELSPNPAQNSITLVVHNVTDLDKVNYQISNVQGQMIKEGRLSGEVMTVDLGLSAGVYFVRLIKDGKDAIQPTKLVIAK